jgi:hypothetical protein
MVNFLNDGLKAKNKDCEISTSEVIKDTLYVMELAGIKKSFDFKEICEKISNIFEILQKYDLAANDIINILSKLINNKNNSWILEKIYKYCTCSNDKYELPLYEFMLSA